jgi:hypothetical protein
MARSIRFCTVTLKAKMLSLLVYATPDEVSRT